MCWREEMIKIALLTDGWKRLVIYAWVDGILSKARELGVEITLHHFNSYGNWSYDPKYNAGEYSLLDVPDLNSYDGVIFDCNNTRDKKTWNKIINHLREVNVPVVSIGSGIDGFCYVGNDNRKLTNKIMNHMYYEHDCRKFVFAGGPKYNYEINERFSAFLDFLTKHGIEVTDDMYMFGDFDFATGEEYMQNWLNEGREFPDVFICANDNIATGMCSVAEKNGYNVPQDFRVTGFDNLDKAAYYKPQITTVAQDREDIGGIALEALLNLINGKDDKMQYFFESEFIPAESCGCPNNGRVDYREFVKYQIENIVKKDLEDVAVKYLENVTEECEDYIDLFKSFCNYIISLKCDGSYIVIDKRLTDLEQTEGFEKEKLDLSKLYVAYALDDLGEHEFSSYDSLEKYIDATGVNSSYMYVSIHFRDELIGFTVLKNPVFLYDSPNFYDIQQVLIKKMENLYKHKKLEYANEKLREINCKDALTGLLNRRGYDEIVAPAFNEYNSLGKSCIIIFYDVDDFKGINDTYGHEYGDYILKSMANVIRMYCPEDGFAYRYGGDEFLVFLPYAEEDAIKAYTDKVKYELQCINIHASYGVVKTNPGKKQNLDEYRVMADEEMYKYKQIYHGKDNA